MYVLLTSPWHDLIWMFTCKCLKYKLYTHTKNPITHGVSHFALLLFGFKQHISLISIHLSVFLSPQSCTVRTPCPDLSSPSLLSAQPNSIRHSSHCRHGAHRVGRHTPQNRTTGFLIESFEWKEL